jgi:DNA-binding transcriptional ArsR family regulator
MTTQDCGRKEEGLAARDLLTGPQAGELAGLFKLLANDSRLRLLHALERAGNLCVSDLARTVGMTPQAVSNQLQRLVDRRVLEPRRVGNSITYRIVDPCVTALLELAWCTAETAAQADRAPLWAHA